MDELEREYLEARRNSLEKAIALINRRLKDENQRSLFSFFEAV
jgi:hypothetical protein